LTKLFIASKRGVFKQLTSAHLYKGAQPISMVRVPIYNWLLHPVTVCT